MELEPGKKLTCCGDEPYNEAEKVYAQNSQWLLHEAFCLFGEADQFKPYEKHHSTVKDACELGERLNVENLILYHTEDKKYSEKTGNVSGRRQEILSWKSVCARRSGCDRVMMEVVTGAAAVENLPMQNRRSADCSRGQAGFTILRPCIPMEVKRNARLRDTAGCRAEKDSGHWNGIPVCQSA